MEEEAGYILRQARSLTPDLHPHFPMHSNPQSNCLAIPKTFFRKIGNLPRFVLLKVNTLLKWKLMFYQKNHPLVGKQRIKTWIWKLTGVNVLGNFKVGQDVYYDVGHAKYITIEEGVWIASRCLLLCHKRILDDYCVGDDYNKLPYKSQPILLKKGCCVGMGTIVMPGVTIGEGSIIGTGSVVTKDIPAWSIAVGNPAKVVRQIKPREELPKIDVEIEFDSQTQSSEASPQTKENKTEDRRLENAT
jgi:serine acetyltransferase